MVSGGAIVLSRMSVAIGNQPNKDIRTTNQ